MTRITVSYRRRDSDAITGRIFDRLVAHYGPDAVFRDIDNIPPGIDYRKYISGALGKTDILLAIVGPQWTGATSEGITRIKQETDLVRIEVETALRREIPVVPVLVGNATMPQPAELPEGLQDFAFRNAVKVDALEDFDDHVKRLIRSLDRLLQPQARSDTQEASDAALTIGASKHVAEELTEEQRLPKSRADKSRPRRPDGLSRTAIKIMSIGVTVFIFLLLLISAYGLSSGRLLRSMELFFIELKHAR